MSGGASVSRGSGASARSSRTRRLPPSSASLTSQTHRGTGTHLDLSVSSYVALEVLATEVAGSVAAVGPAVLRDGGILATTLEPTRPGQLARLGTAPFEAGVKASLRTRTGWREPSRRPPRMSPSTVLAGTLRYRPAAGAIEQLTVVRGSRPFGGRASMHHQPRHCATSSTAATAHPSFSAIAGRRAVPVPPSPCRVPPPTWAQFWAQISTTRPGHGGPGRAMRT